MGVTLSDSRVVKVRGPNTSSIVALSSVRTSSRRSICRAKRDPVGKATVRVSPSSDSGTALASREPLAALALRTLSTTWRHLRCRSEALRCAAGCGAGAGIAYLQGGRDDAVAHTVINALAVDSGIVCDGAKASCAAKIASAVDAGLIGLSMYNKGNQFFGGDGIVKNGVEKTIEAVGQLARRGMKETDEEIIRLMLED